MFGLSNSKEKLESKYQKLLQESYQLSRTNRKKSDEKLAEAEEIRKQIAALNDGPKH
jgi:hypothetical protein